MISRQRKWQIKKQNEGKCKICGKNQYEKSNCYCEEHYEEQKIRNRIINRNAYRIKVGIPLDAPLYTKCSKDQEMTSLEEERLNLLKEKGKMYRDECSRQLNRSFAHLAKKGIIDQIIDKDTGLIYWKCKRDSENNSINEVETFHKNKYKKT